MDSIIPTELPSIELSSLPAKPETKIVKNALAEIDGIVDDCSRLRSADNFFSETSRQEQSGLSRIVTNLNPKEPSYRVANGVLESEGGRLHGRLSSYAKVANENGRVVNFRDDIARILDEVSRSSGDTSLQLTRQAREILQKMISKIDAQRDEAASSRRGIKESALGQTNGLASLRRLSGEASGAIVRKGAAVLEKISDGDRTMVSLEKATREGRQNRRLRFNTLMDEIDKLNSGSNSLPEPQIAKQ